MNAAKRDFQCTHGDIDGMREPGQTRSGPISQAQIRELIERGKLPDRLPEFTLGGPGTGAPCAVCGAAVKREDIGLEIEFTRDESGNVANQHFHVPCFRALGLELDKLELARRAMSSNGGMSSAAAPPPEDGPEIA